MMRIVLIGAYGYTGQLISQLLTEKNISFSAAGRSEQKLLDLQFKLPGISEIIPIDLQTSEISDILDKFDVFINCAGPFTEESSAFLDGLAKRSDKVYLDISGEVGFIRKSFEKNHQSALNNHNLIIHGCAFESVLSDLAIQLLSQEVQGIESVQSFYMFNHSRPSPGTRMTMKLSKFRKLEKISNGSWKEIDNQKDKLNIQLPDQSKKVAVPYPLPEIAFNHWNLELSDSLSYLLLEPEEAMFAGGATTPNSDINEELEKLRTRKKPGPTAEQRGQQEYLLVVQAKNKSGKSGAIKMTGIDMYGITAQCIVIALEKIIQNKDCPSGVLSPAKLFVGEESRILEELDVNFTSIDALDIS